MTKEELLLEIKKYPGEFNAFNFIKTASVDELKRLGLAILFVLSPRITKGIGFVEGYSLDIGISSELKSKHKVMGNLLVRALGDNSDITATEFFETFSEQVKKIESMDY